MATIDDILALDDSHREDVPIPEWKGIKIAVVSMSAEERAEIEKRWSKRELSTDPAGFRADVLLQSLKSDDGSPFGTAEQIRALMKKNGQAVERLFEAACRLSALGKKDLEEMEKN